MSYDAKQHSKDRLGATGLIPAVPMMPIAAQVSQATGMVHLRLMGSAYVRTSLPSIHPASYPATVAAIKACPVEPSYSGSPSPYFRLDVEPLGESFAILKAGDVVIGRVAVFNEADIVSPEQLGEAMAQSEQPPVGPDPVPPPPVPMPPPPPPAADGADQDPVA